MGSRRRRKQRIGNIIKVTAALLLVAAAVVIVWFNYPRTSKSIAMQEFFSDDDGTTWFADDGTKIAPFDHHGKQAVLVRLYKTNSGREFVGYLMKFTEEAKEKALEAQATHQAHGGPSMEKGKGFDGLLVKKPGDADWIPDNDPRAKDIKRVTAPDGSRDFLPALP